MRNYQFGDWLTSLRISNGYSQFQLGKLLGVSDKAVSKWETGAAKPRTTTCAKLATIFGISLDDLMACRQPKVTNRMYSKQSEAEEELWQKARKRLHAIYGETLPIIFQSRFDAEEILMRGTGMIEHLNLKAALWKKGIRCESWFEMESSLTAWLLGAGFVNPLPPHTVCPKCKKTVLHLEAKDGWDLPMEKCECGANLKRDGHNIGLALTEKKFEEMDRRQFLEIDVHDEKALLETIQAQYQDRWKLTEYCLPQDEGMLASFFEISTKFFLLSPSHVQLPFPLVDGKCLLPSDDYILRIMDLPETMLYIGIEPQPSKQLNVSFDQPSFCVDELMRQDLLQQARQEVTMIPAMTLAFMDDFAIEVKESASKKCIPDGKNITDVKRFSSEDIGAFLPDTLRFSDLMQCCASSFRITWHEFAGNLVKSGIISLGMLPSSLEDLFDLIKRNMLNAGIQDNGIVLKVFESMQKNGPSLEIANSLHAIGCDEWLTSYVKHISTHRSIENKVNLVIQAYYLLHRLATCQKDNTEGIEATDTCGRKMSSSFKFSDFFCLTMIQHAFNMAKLNENDT